MDVVGITVRLVLVLLSIVSFLPQLQLIWTNRHCTGISLSYILCNLIVATFHLTLALHFVVIESEGRFLSNDPPDARDWLNLIQFLVAWLGQLCLFSLALALPPQRTARKGGLMIAYLLFLSITLLPTIMVAFESEEDQDQGWASDLLVGALVYLVAPGVQAIGVLAFIAQARETFRHHGSGSLSVRGLFMQAAVFSLVGISFMFRLKLPAENWKYYLPNVLREWYWLVGWATLNNLIFALAQGVLGWILVRQQKEDVMQIFSCKTPGTPGTPDSD
ncbi:unnamed protein product [Zymoseptoria tritici ST99CH_3D7]|uniref:Uncharacterized protein n=2 Tax=Zymoseptoria tritici TaxID=1047171 RepID=A0A1X7RCK2_ZYMT9|nr:unnamed protein product [Zymoseptoria tritici ST99CH_3D7]SMR41509.1 unnamed protein product [Zymoseptoria tritici ST99CH_1E4]